MSDQYFNIEDLQSLTRIVNRNEKRVRDLIPEVLLEYPDYEPEVLDVEDIYALTLNNLPPRYTQERSIVLKEKVTDEIIRHEIRRAVLNVKDNPQYE